MIRVPVAVAVALTLSLFLAACGSPETPATEKAQPAEPRAAEPVPSLPNDAPPQEEAELADGGPIAISDRRCSDAADPKIVARLVERCIAVSPATRPPCNAANPCAMIVEEIERSCAQYGPGEAKPAECVA